MRGVSPLPRTVRTSNFWPMCCFLQSLRRSEAETGRLPSKVACAPFRPGLTIIGCLVLLPSAYCTPIVEGRVSVTKCGQHACWYRVVRPALLHAGIGTAAPLVVCHGGPGVPSDYLFDLSKVGNRAVVFYDQLGAGRSDSPPLDAQTADEYCPAGFVRHLDAVLSALGLARFHLYGQSWGGILAFEYVRTACLTSSKSTQQLPLPLSLTLSNTPSSVALVEAEAARLLDACGGDPNAFSLAHTCRVVPPPALLADAYAHAGTVWRGTAAISGWEADLSQLDRKRWPLHTLLMTAEADFVTPACMRAWETLPGCRTVQIAGASHHALLEEPEQYFRLLVEHLEECD
uniref:AB hydrolase-1 domain-containing protein n=1 Tax=Chrysotila carterae TaxID=13221 RepID=A0A7S4C1E5_CHRCT